MQVDSPVNPWNEPIHEGIVPALPQTPTEFLDVVNEGRLIASLRGRAKLRNPITILAHSATEFFKARRAPTNDRPAILKLATAFADLAVTGRQSYDQFKNGINLVSLEGAIRARLQAQSLPAPPTDAEIKEAQDNALNRAYAVAWALRGPVVQRAALRAPLGWIAVSAEDDTPHRPLNMPAPPFEQYEVRVRTPVASGELAVWTRFFVACADEAPGAAVPVPARSAPIDPLPNIPADHSVVLFLHGHSSGAEEALDLIPHLLEQGLRQGKKYAVISFDLPNNGYSETFNHTSVAPSNATMFPFLPTDNTPIHTPILDFIENFVVAFVDAVEDVTTLNGRPRIKHRIAAVIGGSLGGNLGLRLGRRKAMPPWLSATTIVAWSPASVWPAKAKNDIGREASRDTIIEYQKSETESARRDYFFRVYEQVRRAGAIIITNPQPSYWYGTSFPNAASNIQFSRIARREIYNANYRQWHWRVACEQLIYSHVENEVYGDSSTPVRYTLNTVNTLLAAGEEDDANYVNIYSHTKHMGESMTQTPGRLLLIRRTGHSIHLERPQFFADQIETFLSNRAAPDASTPIPWSRGGTQAFDAAFYLGYYGDLTAAFGNDAVAARDHWLNQGLPHEGRRGSREFDVQFYLSHYPDVSAAAGTDYAAALDHWLTQGLPNEGRRGSREFDVRFYLERYGALMNAFGTTYAAALNHWLTRGLPIEGRAGAREVDAITYIGESGDVRMASDANYPGALDRWIAQGLPGEGRRASDTFDLQDYLAAYADVKAAFGNSYPAAFDHWLRAGIAEGRRGAGYPYKQFRLQTGTALHETDQTFEFGVGANGDLFAIKKSATGSGTTEVHVLSAASGYRQFSVQTGTALHETDQTFEFGIALNGDVFAIKKSATGSGTTEVHVLSAASGYRQFSLQTGTALHQTDRTFEFGVAANRDVVAIKKSATGSGTTEVHVLSAVSGYQQFSLQTRSALHVTDQTFEFGVALNRDVLAIKKSGTGSGTTEIHVLSAASGYQQFSLQTGTALHQVDQTFAFGVGLNRDVFAVKKSNTGSGSTELHVLRR